MKKQKRRVLAGLSVVIVVVLAWTLVLPGIMYVAGDEDGGAVGPPGPPGPAGPAGADGENGLNGLNGENGLNGLNGLDGADGAAGAGGADGAQGPPGPGTLMASASSSVQQALTSTCTNHAGGEVTITVPGPGTVVVTAKANIAVRHTSAIDDVELYLDTSPSGCVADAWQSSYFISGPVTNALSADATFVHKPFIITAAGTYTFYLNAIMFSGLDPDDRIGQSSMIAVFYPS